MRIQFTVSDEELKILTKKAEEGNYPSISEYCKCSSLQENTSYVDLYNTLLNKISSLPKGKEFVLRKLIATPPALIGRWFYENVNKGLVKNVEHIGKAEGGVEKYKRIWDLFQKAIQCVADWKRYLDNVGGAFHGRRK